MGPERKTRFGGRAALALLAALLCCGITGVSAACDRIAVGRALVRCDISCCGSKGCLCDVQPCPDLSCSSATFHNNVMCSYHACRAQALRDLSCTVDPAYDTVYLAVAGEEAKCNQISSFYGCGWRDYDLATTCIKRLQCRSLTAGGGPCGQACSDSAIDCYADNGCLPDTQRQTLCADHIAPTFFPSCTSGNESCVFSLARYPVTPEPVAVEGSSSNVVTPIVAVVITVVVAGAGAIAAVCYFERKKRDRLNNTTVFIDGTVKTDGMGGSLRSRRSSQDVQSPSLARDDLYVVDAFHSHTSEGEEGETELDPAHHPQKPIDLRKPQLYQSVTVGPDAESKRIWGFIESGCFTQGAIVGSGSTASVYLVHLNDGDLVAVKRIDATTMTEPERAEMYSHLSEMCSLQHENFVRCFAVNWLLDGSSVTMQVWMEYASKGSLASLARRLSVPLPDHIAAKYIREVLLGVAYLHERSVVHRDIKGDNVLLVNDSATATSDVAKLADFSSAKRFDVVSTSVSQQRGDRGERASSSLGSGGNKSPSPSNPNSMGTPSMVSPSISAYNINSNSRQNTTDTIVGTPLWMAPEIVNGNGYNFKADIWSIGITAAEIVNKGVPPWPEFDTPWAAVYHIAEHEPTLPTVCSQECMDFMVACLERDPSLRPTAVQLLAHPWIAAVGSPEATAAPQ